jgi:hypothetical protein
LIVTRGCLDSASRDSSRPRTSGRRADPRARELQLPSDGRDDDQQVGDLRDSVEQVGGDARQALVGEVARREYVHDEGGLQR